MNHQSNDRTPNLTLAIELSNPSASSTSHAVALFSQDHAGASLISSDRIPAGIRGSDGIMVLVESLSKEHGISPSDISRIIVSVGPGGYTALRISTTTAKVLAQIIGCDLVAVSSAKVAAMAVNDCDRPALIALASKNKHTHGTLLQADGGLEILGMIDADMIESLGIRSIVSDSYLPQSFEERAQQLGIDRHPIVLDARACYEAAKGLGPVLPEEIAPIYAREPDAMTQWRARTES